MILKGTRARNPTAFMEDRKETDTAGGEVVE